MVVEIKFNKVSLLDRIKRAESNDELLELTEEGFGYEYASTNTQVKWGKAILIRKAELEKATEKPVTEAKTNPRAKTDRKGNKKRRDG